jgi:restriction system protein
MGFNYILNGFAAGLEPAVIDLWPLWALFGAALVYWLAHRASSAQRLAQSGIRAIDQMAETAFERRLVVLFRELGYSVTPTGQAGDCGVELVIRKNGVTTAAQGKLASAHLGVEAVHDAVAARRKYNCTAAIVVTNSYFTAQAQTLARADAVELWDRDQLVTRLLKIQPMAEAGPAG